MILPEWCWCDGGDLHVRRLKIVHFIVANHTAHALNAPRHRSTLDSVVHAEICCWRTFVKTSELKSIRNYVYLTFDGNFATNGLSDVVFTFAKVCMSRVRRCDTKPIKIRSGNDLYIYIILHRSIWMKLQLRSWTLHLMSSHLREACG